MIKGIITRIVTTSLGRWILGSVVALLISGAAWKWHAFKEDLIHQGQVVCVQEINKQTVIDLQDALAAERVTSQRMQDLARAAATANARAKSRLTFSQARVNLLLKEKKEQEKTDETYAAWSNTPLPSGVAGRLRNAQSGSDPDTVPGNSN